MSSAVPSGLELVPQKYSSLFESNLECYNGLKVDLKVNKEPKFHKARSVPHALKSKAKVVVRSG